MSRSLAAAAASSVVTHIMLGYNSVRLQGQLMSPFSSVTFPLALAQLIQSPAVAHAQHGMQVPLLAEPAVELCTHATRCEVRLAAAWKRLTLMPARSELQLPDCAFILLPFLKMVRRYSHAVTDCQA